MTYQPYEPGGPNESPSAETVPAAPYRSRSPQPPTEGGRLAEPPRPVPLSYRIAVLSLGPTPLFVLYVTAISCMAVWILSPLARVLGILVGIAALAMWSAWRYRRFVPVLRRGEVAAVRKVETKAGMGSYENWPVRRARGWLGRWEFYSGSGAATTIDFAVANTNGTIKLRGAPYDGGIILADPRDPSRSLCVSQLPFSITPGPDGRYADPVPISSWVLTFLTLAPLLALTAALVGMLVR